MKKGLRMKELDKFKKNNCTCEECTSYCERTPGWFRPKEIPLLAEFLKMSIQEIYEQYLIVDFWAGNSSNIYVLTPVKDFERLKKSTDSIQRETAKLFFETRSLLDARQDQDKAGSCASWGYAFWRGPCVFLKEGKCAIYSVRPFECAIAHHKKKTPKNMRELILREWRNDPLIETLLNRRIKKGG